MIETIGKCEEKFHHKNQAFCCWCCCVTKEYHDRRWMLPKVREKVEAMKWKIERIFMRSYWCWSAGTRHEFISLLSSQMEIMVRFFSFNSFTLSSHSHSLFNSLFTSLNFSLKPFSFLLLFADMWTNSNIKKLFVD